MKKLITSVLLGLISPLVIFAQSVNVPIANNNTWADAQPRPAFTAAGPKTTVKTSFNLSSVTPVKYNRSEEAVRFNKEYAQHPELGALYPDAPCADCFELLEKRTEKAKYFVKEGTDGKDFIIHSSSEPVHYKDAEGRWATICDRLMPDASIDGLYSTSGRPYTISVNTKAGYVRVSSATGSFTYNRNLELIYVDPSGSEHSIGKASWSNFVVGDDGMLVKDVWPGIDMEIATLINRVKTNFILKNALPAYASGKLYIRDYMAPGEGLHLEHEGNAERFAGAFTIADANGQGFYQMEKAVAFQQKNPATTNEPLNYHIATKNTVDIEVPGSWLSAPASAYPVVIDPLLVTGTAATGGFSYHPTFLVKCTNNNDVIVPAGTVLTDFRVTYAVTGVVGASQSQQSVQFEINGNCLTNRMDCPTYVPGGIGVGGCGHTNVSFWTIPGWGSASCKPAISCSPFTLPFRMYNSQSHLTTGACLQTVFASSVPFQVEVFGTLSSIPNPAISPSTPTSVCVGSTVPLSGGPSGGAWSSSNLAVGTVSTSGVVRGMSTGTTNITYAVTATCGTLYAVKTVTVHAPASVAPITGAPRVCVASSTPLACVTPGGTWLSTIPTIGSINSSGSCTGVSAGVTLISYTVTNACGAYASTRIMTVDALPAAGSISGTANICISTTTTLTASVGGGTWSSSVPAVGTVSAGGVVNGLAGGTTTISYTTTNTYCSVTTTAVVTVSITPVAGTISGVADICQGAAHHFTNTATGGTWSSSAPLIATAGSSTGLVKGMAEGTATITFTNSNVCATVTATFAVNVKPVFIGTWGSISTIAGNGFTGHTGDGGPGTSANIYPVYYVVSDTAGNVFMSDSAGLIRKLTPSGIISTVTTAHNASSLAADNLGNVYFADITSGEVYKINSAGAISLYLPSVGTVYGMDFDKEGNLYISSFGGGVINRYTPPSTTATLFAGDGTAVFAGDGGPATLASLGPWLFGVCADPGKNVHISTAYPSSAYNRVRKVAPDGIITTVVNTAGLPGFSGDGGPATAAEVAWASYIDADALGNLYISDNENYRVRRVDVNTGIINTVVGTGVAFYSGDGVAPTAANVDPNGIHIDRSGNMILADALNHRVRRIPNVAGTIAGPSSVCVGATITLTNTFYPTYSSWTSSNPGAATVSSSGVVTGVAAGSTIITYRVSNSCSWAYATKVIIINPLPLAGTISGASTVCAGATISLSTTGAGGTWSSSATGTATVSSFGVVSGISAGTTLISYTVTSSCGSTSATVNITVSPLPDAGTITGDASTICIGGIANLSDPVAGGSWGSIGSHISVASSGIATGVSLGDDTATYTVNDGTCTAKAKYPITVNCEAGVEGVNGSGYNMLVSPNPNSGVFQVRVTSPVSEEVTIAITDVTGRKVKEFIMQSNTMEQISLGQASGVYLVSAVSSHPYQSVRVVITK